jgi:hypothetical protein
MAKNSGVRKLPLPKVSMGLGNVLAQSAVVVSAFGKPMGFVIMMTAVAGSAALGVGMAYVFARGLIRFLWSA